MAMKFLIFLAGSALAVSACNRNTSANDNVALDNGAADNGVLLGNEAPAEAADPTTAQGFVNAAAASDKFEIESSKLAAGAASSAAVKKFATQMISAHTASTAKLKATLGTLTPPVTPDDTLSADQQATLDSLKGLNGSAFDSAYAAAQVDAHQKTLDTLKAYSASGDNAALKTFATNLQPTVAAHLNLAKGLK